MVTFTAKSGAEIVINAAPWQDAKRLKAAIENEAAKSQVPTNFSAENLSAVFGTALKIDSSPEVDAALWPCLIRCTRGGKKIVESTFDDVEARSDYYEIIMACVKENFLPFVGDLYFLLAALGMSPVKAPQKENAPESASPTSASLQP